MTRTSKNAPKLRQTFIATVERLDAAELDKALAIVAELAAKQHQREGQAK